MRWIDIFRISLRMLKTNLLRSVLTVLGIGVAVGIIVILIGLGYGLQQITIGSIVESKSLYSLEISPVPDQPFSLTMDTVEEIKAAPETQEITPVVSVGGEVKIKDKLASIKIIAAKAAYFDMEGISLAQGTLYQDEQAQLALSPEIIELLDFKPQELINQKVSLNYTDPNNQNESKHLENVTVVGITEKSDGPTIYLPIDMIAADGKLNLSSIKIVAPDRPSIISLQKKMSEKGYQVETLLDTLDQAKKIFNWVTVALTIIGVIALIVSAIGMFNTLTIALLERTREIGVMKAIGVTDQSVKRLFLAEAGITGFLGGLTGVISGLICGVGIELVLNQISYQYGGGKINLFQYPTGFLIGMIIFPIFLSLLTGLYPALRAARLNPLQALRYE